MSLLEEARKIEEQLLSRQQELAIREESLNAKEKEIAEKEVEYKKLEKSVKALIKEKDDKLAKIELDNAIEERLEKVEFGEKELNKQKAEYRVWENRLARIESNQEKEAQKLAEEKAKLELDRKTYKEQLKKEFFELLENKAKGL